MSLLVGFLEVVFALFCEQLIENNNAQVWDHDVQLLPDLKTGSRPDIAVSAWKKCLRVIYFGFRICVPMPRLTFGCDCSRL